MSISEKESNASEECTNFTAFMASVIDEPLKKEVLSESCESSDSNGDEMSFDSAYETLYKECLSLKQEQVEWKTSERSLINEIKTLKGEKKSLLDKVLLFSFVLTTFTYLAMAMVGYLMYGDSVESQITLSLPTSKVCAEVAIYTTLLIPITRYALMVTPVATAIEGGLSENYKNQRTVRLLIRVGLLISTVIVAYVFPYYESLMAIVGSIFVVSASFLLPCLCYLKINSDWRWGWNCEQMGIVGILVFGTLAGV
ncbi:Amino acid transporter AVT1I [Vitis vinifera]|uniref:Amino acid transporter AVT1I n=1 Tax=Vitis vinifera TaxID=29760 RepID=A0A438HYQ4_VITVI|nr:Amino acid transporter AVT1I [Vitis vinifera]